MIRVLMVDDDSVMLDLTTIFLEKSGDIEVNAVQSAKAAMEKLQTTYYDVIISDYIMPEMDGLTFLKTLRDRNFDIPFILFTGKGREEVVIEALNRGADYYLQKDRDPNVLYAELSHQVRQAAERQRTRQALGESENRYRTFVQNFRGIAFRSTIENVPLFVHGMVKEITGYDKEEFISGKLRWDQIIHPGDLSWVMGDADKASTIPDYSSVREYRILCKNGEVRWLHEQVHNVCDTSGKPVEVEGTIYDITDRKFAEKQIIMQRDLAQKLSGVASLDEALEICVDTAMHTSGMDCGTVYLTEKESDDLVLSYSKGLSDRFVEIISHNARDSYRWREVMAGRSYYVTYQDVDLPLQAQREREGIRAMALVPIVHRDRVIGCYNIGSRNSNEVPVFSRNALETIGAMTGNAIVRIQAEAEVHENQNELQTLFDSMQDFLFVTDSKGRILRTNAAVTRLLSYAPDELVDMNISQLHPPEQHDEAVSTFAKIVEGKDHLCTIPLQAKDGNLISVETKITPGRWGNQNVFFGISRDVSDRNRMEDALFTSNKKLQDIIEFLPDATFVIDQDRKVISWNLAMEEMTGVCKEDIVGKGDYAYGEPFYGFKRPILIDLIFSSDREVEHCYSRIRRKGHTIFAESFAPCLYEGKDASLWGTASPLFDGEGNVVGAIESIRDITELRQAEKELRETRDYLDKLLQFASAPIAVWDPHMKFTRFNRAFERLTGYTAEEVIGKGPALLLSEEDREESLEKINYTSEGERWESVEIPVLCKNGEIRIVLWNSANVCSEDGKTLQATIIQGQDITELKRAEKALKEGEDRFKKLFEQSNDAIFIHNQYDQQIIDINSRACEMLGYEASQLKDMNIQMLHPESELDTSKRAFQETEARGYTRFESQLVRADGTVIDVEISSRVVDDEKGIIQGIVRDISERKGIEVALMESEERFNLAVKSANLGIWDWNVATGEVVRSKSLAEMLGYALEDLEGGQKTWEWLVHPEDLPRAKKELWNALDGNTPHFESEYRMRCKDGGWKCIYDEGMVVSWDEKGRPLRMTGVLQDVTKMRRYQDALKEANKKLNLLSSVTRHDLLNQISGVSGYAQLLSEMLPPDPAMQQYAGCISQLVENIRHQVVFTRDYQDMGVKAAKWQNVEKAVQHAASTVTLNGVHVKVETGLWEVFADPLLEKAFSNLIENAIRHGKRTTEIRVSSNEREGQKILIFEDNGVGVPTQMKGQIFKRAFGEHTGYGLFLVKEILGITGMTIEECGEEGKGARFEIAVPIGHYRESQE